MDEIPNIAPEILAHYEAGEEPDRLKANWGLLEFIRTKAIIDRCLPPPPAVVLDVGGGSGPYALWLARKGHEVHLLDPVPALLEVAAAESETQPETPIATITRGDARRLPWADARADVVLMLGPLYHLPDRSDRLRALGEVRRVLRPGGRLLVAGISRFASVIGGFHGRLVDDPRFRIIVERDLDDGRHVNDTDDPNYFTTAYFHHPDELRAEVREAGFELDAMLAVEGPFWTAPDLVDRLADAERLDFLLRMIRRIESDHALLGASAHFLAVASPADDQDRSTVSS